MIEQCCCAIRCRRIGGQYHRALEVLQAAALRDELKRLRESVLISPL